MRFDELFFPFKNNDHGPGNLNPQPGPFSFSGYDSLVKFFNSSKNDLLKWLALLLAPVKINT